MATLLRPRHELFAQNVAKGMKPGDALALADPTDANKEAPNRHATVNRMMANVQVKARIAELLEPTVEKTKITIEMLLDTFIGQGTFDPVVFEGVTSLNDLKTKVDEHTRRLLVKGWKYDKQGRFILDLVDKDAALDRLARHLSFYRDIIKVEVVDYAALLTHAETQTGQTIEGTVNRADAPE